MKPLLFDCLRKSGKDLDRMRSSRRTFTMRGSCHLTTEFTNSRRVQAGLLYGGDTIVLP